MDDKSGVLYPNFSGKQNVNEKQTKHLVWAYTGFSR